MIARSTYTFRFFFILLLVLSGCSEQSDDKSWLSAIPAESPLVILYDDANLTDALEDRRFIMMEELSDVQINTVTDMIEHVSNPVTLKAVALYPTGSHQLQPVFIIDDPGNGVNALARHFHKEFAENSYRFRNQDIRILHLDGQRLFAAQIKDWIFLSKNSVAIENSIMAYSGEHPGISVQKNEVASGSYLLNTPELGNWLNQLGAPRYLPRFSGIFEGTGPTILSLSRDTYDDPLFDARLRGDIPLHEAELSGFAGSFASTPASFDLDRYIPTDAAFFTIFHQDPGAAALDEMRPAGRLDSLLLSDNRMAENIRQSLDPATAFVAFEASGFLSVGEHMYLRRLSDPSDFNSLLRELQRDGFIEVSNDVYYLNSPVMGQILGGPNSRLTDFYVIRSANAAIITKRSGLARRIDQDRRRRAVYYYDDAYMAVRQRHPDQVSAWIYTRTSPLLNYLEPMLNPLNHARFLGSLLDIGAVSLVRNGDSMALTMDTYFSEDRTEPVRDVWAFDLRGSRITGKPTLANIGGGSRDELVIATESNHIYGIAADGTGFLEVNTANDRPLGSPLVYDWYGNNQHAILIAAGNKIYAWNTRGIPLPNFPVTMDERITTPLTLADVARDGRPEMIVTTADRKVHVLDQRGRNIPGWPRDINIQASQQPVFNEFADEHTLWITAGNGLFGFSPRGNLRDGYPVFIESDLGPVTFHGRHIIAGAADGHLYAIGREPFFADSLVVAPDNNTYSNSQQNNGRNNRSDLIVRRVYVGNSPILNAPIVQTLTLDHDDGQRIRERMIGVQNLNGNLFLLNEGGQLRMTRNMGQSSASYANMLITDVNGNGKPDMVGVSNTGRVYAWQVESGEPIGDIPSASMRYPMVTNILGAGERELIGQTRDGMRCWSFRRP